MKNELLRRLYYGEIHPWERTAPPDADEQELNQRIDKCFTVDFLTKKRKVNEGEVPQYYVEHSHEPIITPEEFDKVQTELARRKQISRQYSGKSIFSSRIVCGDCGSYFGSKVWNSTSKYRRDDERRGRVLVSGGPR